MKQSINFSNFCDAFRDYGRNAQFSYEAKRILFDYFERLEDDCGTEIELDVAALCCEFSEDTLEDIISNYSIDVSECEDELDKLMLVTDYLENNTSFLGGTSDKTLVYQQF